jgi:hypothetical protein
MIVTISAEIPTGQHPAFTALVNLPGVFGFVPTTKFSTKLGGANLWLGSLSLNKPTETHIFLKIPDSASNLYMPLHNSFPFQKKKFVYLLQPLRIRLSGFLKA